MKRNILIAGVGGVLGRELVEAFIKRSIQPAGLALFDREFNGLEGKLSSKVTADVTKAETLRGVCAGMDTVVSVIGITRIRGHVTHMDVDYQGNMNLLAEAQRAGETVAWIQRVGGMLYPPDLAAAGVDVAALDVDFYTFSSHKLFGPTGLGILYGKAERLAAMAPYQGGGEMIGTVSMDRITYADPPHRFEAGTPPILEAIGFAAALDWLDTVDRDAAFAHEHAVYQRAADGLAGMNGLRILGQTPDKGAILTFALEGAHAHDVAQILDRYGVAVRAGTHCAEPLMRRFGMTSSVRASFALYNTLEEADALVEALHKASRFFS